MNDLHEGLTAVGEGFAQFREQIVAFSNAMRPVLIEWARFGDHQRLHAYLDREERRERRACPSRGRQIRMAYRRRRR